MNSVNDLACMKLKEPWILVMRSSRCCFLRMGSLGRAGGELKTSTTGADNSMACQDLKERN